MIKGNHLILCTAFIICQLMQGSAPQPADAPVGSAAAVAVASPEGTAAANPPSATSVYSAVAAAPDGSALAEAAKSLASGGAGPAGISDGAAATQASAAVSVPTTAATGASDKPNVYRTGKLYGMKKNGVLGFGGKAPYDIVMDDLKKLKLGEVFRVDNELENATLINSAIASITGNANPANVAKVIELQRAAKTAKMPIPEVARRTMRTFLEAHLKQESDLLEQETIKRAAAMRTTKLALHGLHDKDLGSKTDDEDSDVESYDSTELILKKTGIAKQTFKKAEKESAAAAPALAAPAAADASAAAK